MGALRFARWAVLAAVLLVAAGCGSAAESDSPPKSVTVDLGTEFTLAPGSTAHLDSDHLAVTFREVSDDSRCPEDVTCVWAGDITVVLMTTAGTTESRYELHRNAPRDSAVTDGGYRIELKAVHPARRSDQKISPDAYRVDLLVTRT